MSGPRFRRVCPGCGAPCACEYVTKAPAGTVVWRSEDEGNTLVIHGDPCAACRRSQLVVLYHAMHRHEQSPELVREVLRRRGKSRFPALVRRLLGR